MLEVNEQALGAHKHYSAKQLVKLYEAWDKPDEAEKWREIERAQDPGAAKSSSD